MHESTLGAVALCAIGAPAAAQEAMYTEAATMPSPGVSVVRTQLHFYRFDSDPKSDIERTDKYEWSTSLQYGLARAWSLRLETPLVWETDRLRGGRTDHDHGVSDLDATLKWRFYKQDTGGVDTLRAALMAGAYFASGDDKDFSSQSVNPHIGAVVTLVQGRFGFNLELAYQFNTGPGGIDNTEGGAGTADALRYNSAFLYRIFPNRYTSDSTGAWYATVELNGLYETNGDHDIRWAPGLMYEGQAFALEFMAQLPLWQHLDERPRLDFGFGIGLRVTF